MSIDTSHSIVKSFKSFFLGTFLSRISGFLRDITLAFFFGTSPFIAYFMVAYRFANFFRRLLGESSLTASFIPHYETLRLEDKKKSSKFYLDLFFSLSIFLIIIISLSEVSLYFISKSFFQKEIIYLTQIMTLGLFFICLYALNSSFLQCHKNYFLASIAPVVFNITWIAFTIIYRKWPVEEFVYVLSFGVVIAFLFQYLITSFTSFKIIFKDIPKKDIFKINLFNSEIKKLIKPITYSIIGIGAIQINSLIDSIFAALVDPRAASYLWYSIRLYQLPLSLFGISIVSAILPPLTRAYNNSELENFKSFFNLAILKSLAFMLPFTFAIIAIGPSLINLIYKRGAFNIESLINTNNCLFGYILGLCFSSLVMILSQVFYAKKKYFIPTVSSLISVVINIFLNAIFIYVFNMKAISIAIATSISSFFNFLILYYFLKKDFFKIFEKKVFIKILKIVICSFSSFLITILIGKFLKDASIIFLLNRSFELPSSFFLKLSSFSLLSLIFGSSYFLLGFLLKSKEVIDILIFKKVN